MTVTFPQPRARCWTYSARAGSDSTEIAEAAFPANQRVEWPDPYSKTRARVGTRSARKLMAGYGNQGIGSPSEEIGALAPALASHPDSRRPRRASRARRTPVRAVPRGAL